MMGFLITRIVILLVNSLLYDTSKYSCDKNIVPCGCGQTNVQINTRIVNGENAVPKSWPMMVSLQSYNSNLPNHFCGGTIVSESYILTAAHCVDMYPADSSSIDLAIAAGIRDINQSDPIIRQVDKIIIHPSYIRGYYDIYNDIALLHLAEPLDLTINSSIIRTCLPPHTNNLEEIMQYPSNGTNLVVIGWGRLVFRGLVPNTLQQVTINSINHFDKICANTIRDPSTQFCAGLHEGGKGEK